MIIFFHFRTGLAPSIEIPPTYFCKTKNDTALSILDGTIEVLVRTFNTKYTFIFIVLIRTQKGADAYIRPFDNWRDATYPPNLSGHLPRKITSKERSILPSEVRMWKPNGSDHFVIAVVIIRRHCWMNMFFIKK